MEQAGEIITILTQGILLIYGAVLLIVVCIVWFAFLCGISPIKIFKILSGKKILTDEEILKAGMESEGLEYKPGENYNNDFMDGANWACSQ